MQVQTSSPWVCQNWSAKLSTCFGKECIKPVKIEKKVGTGGKIKIEDDGSYLQVREDGSKIKLEKAKITLNDCLACSGCITSAESVLINQQSQEELYRIFKENAAECKDGGCCKKKTVVISISPQSRVSLAAKYKLTQTETAKKLTAFFKKLGAEYVLDSTFARNFSLLESQKEFIKRYQSRDADRTSFPMLCSACPGWICYAEKTHGSFILPYISTTKSPQQIMGALVKDHLAQRLGKTPDQIYHVTVEPCYDKKLEASRQDFYTDLYSTRDVDCVITSIEVDQMLEKEGLLLSEIQDYELDSVFSTSVNDELIGHTGSGSGGYAEHIFRHAAFTLFGETVEHLKFNIVKNQDMRELTLEKNGEVVLKFAQAYGFRNIQNIVQKLKRGKCSYHFVEVMACPSGCLNGGAQIRSQEGELPKDLIERANAIYSSLKTELPEENKDVQQLYETWLKGTDPEKVSQLLHTQYHAIEKNTNALAIKW